jgi:hypothetical protein
MAKQVITIVIEDGTVQKSDKLINNKLPDGSSIFSFILTIRTMTVHFRFRLLKVWQLFS